MADETVPFDPDLLDSWLLALRAERKSPETLKSYRDGVTAYIRWCQDQKRAVAFSRRHVQEFTAWLVEDQGREASTALSRHLACRRFSAWLLEEQEVPTDPLVGLKGPKLDEKVVMPLTDQELQALFAACRGTDFRARRDEALMRFMAESGARASEAVNLLIAETSVSAGTTVIRRGKGGKGRLVPFGPQTGRAIDRYIRLRKTHRLAASERLWLGDRGKGFSYDALHKVLTGRAVDAGVEGFHPHRLRHTFADRWLDRGGSESGLMAVAGWERPEMLLRYTRGRRSARALDEARGLNLGDL